MSEPAVLFFHRDNAIAAAFLPAMVQRLQAFCGNYDTETDPEELAEQVWRMYAMKDTRLALWGVIRNYQVVGHLMAQAEPVGLPQGPWDYLLIRQAEVDKKVNAIAACKQIFTETEQYGLRIGVDRLLMLTHRTEAVMARKWGFTPWKHIMQKRLKETS